MGVFPTLETCIGQSFLIVAYIIALFYTFIIKNEKADRPKKNVNKPRNNIAGIQNLVDLISNHAKECEVYLQNIENQKHKELATHLHEIHKKLNELSIQVLDMRNQNLEK